MPYHVRFCIDAGVRCGHWYTVTSMVRPPSASSNSACCNSACTNSARSNSACRSSAYCILGTLTLHSLTLPALILHAQIMHALILRAAILHALTLHVLILHASVLHALILHGLLCILHTPFGGVTLIVNHLHPVLPTDTLCGCVCIMAGCSCCTVVLQHKLCIGYTAVSNRECRRQLNLCGKQRNQSSPKRRLRHAALAVLRAVYRLMRRCHHHMGHISKRVLISRFLLSGWCATSSASTADHK